MKLTLRNLIRVIRFLIEFDRHTTRRLLVLMNLFGVWAEKRQRTKIARLARLEAKLQS
jgi:hypothetical protein